MVLDYHIHIGKVEYIHIKAARYLWIGECHWIMRG